MTNRAGYQWERASYFHKLEAQPSWLRCAPWPYIVEGRCIYIFTESDWGMLNLNMTRCPIYGASLTQKRMLSVVINLLQSPSSEIGNGNPPGAPPGGTRWLLRRVLVGGVVGVVGGCRVVDVDDIIVLLSDAALLPLPDKWKITTTFRIVTGKITKRVAGRPSHRMSKYWGC